MLQHQTVELSISVCCEPVPQMMMSALQCLSRLCDKRLHLHSLVSHNYWRSDSSHTAHLSTSAKPAGLLRFVVAADEFWFYYRQCTETRTTTFRTNTRVSMEIESIVANSALIRAREGKSSFFLCFF